MRGQPLARGAKVILTKENPSLTSVVLGLRWDTGSGSDPVLDANLVAAAMLCGKDNKVLSDEHFVFFNQLTSPDASTAKLEELVGDDAEQIEVDLRAVPSDVDRIVVVVYLNEGSTALRSLGRLQHCSVRVLDLSDNRELARSEDMAPSLTTETALVMGYLYRYNGSEWRFRVMGQGYSSGLKGVADDYGVSL